MTDCPRTGSRCVRAPAGVLFHVHRDDGSGEVVLTDRHGELAFQKPDGVGVEVDMPQGVNGRFPRCSVTSRWTSSTASCQRSFMRTWDNGGLQAGLCVGAVTEWSRYEREGGSHERDAVWL